MGYRRDLWQWLDDQPPMRGFFAASVIGFVVVIAVCSFVLLLI